MENDNKTIEEELEEITQRMKDRNEELDSLQTNDEKQEYLKNNMSEFLDDNKKSDELLDKMFDNMHELYETTMKQSTSIKETKIIIRKRNYNGSYGTGDIFVNEQIINVMQLLNNSNHEGGLIKYSKRIGFCASEEIGAEPLANIIMEIPFLISYDKINSFNEIVETIKSNPNYKYDESHYTKDRFDPKSLTYVDVIIDGEEFEINIEDKKIYDELLGDISKYIDIADQYYQKLSSLIKQTNKVVHDDPNLLNVPYEERIVSKLVNKVRELPSNVETTIAQLLELSNKDVANIEPLIQGTVFNNLVKACEESNIKLEINHDEIGGLGYHYKFIKK